MKASKSILMSLLVLAGVTAQAQSDLGSTELTAPMPTAPRAQTWNQSGLQLSLTMSNFTGGNLFESVSASSAFGSANGSGTTALGMGLETYGLEAGYNSLPSQGFGWYAGGFIRKTLQNGSEVTEVGFAGLRGNAQYAFNKWIYCYLGANLTDVYEYPKFDSLYGSTTYQPNVSGQAGFGFRVNRSLSLYGGYENFAFIEKTNNNSAFSGINVNTTDYVYLDGITLGLAWTL